MNYFPAYIKIDNKKVLIVGGGKIAKDKLIHLLDFTKNISIIATKISDEIKTIAFKNNLSTTERKYEKNNINGYDIVIIAVDEVKIQKDIFIEASKKHILCNAVDSVDYCDFIFPSYIKKGDLTISVSTSGSSPAVAKYLRKYIEQILPDGIDNFLVNMKNYRKKLPKGALRMKYLDEKARLFFDKKRKKQ